jgi:hypothetical protein
LFVLHRIQRTNNRAIESKLDELKVRSMRAPKNVP